MLTDGRLRRFPRAGRPAPGDYQRDLGHGDGIANYAFFEILCIFVLYAEGKLDSFSSRCHGD